VVQEHLVELGPQHLPGLRHRVFVVPVEEVERLAGFAVGGDELHAVFLLKRRPLH
jgi:hypothetical protein